MNPYTYVREATEDGKSLLSLCCGIGLELSGLPGEVTAVDIVPQYLEQVKHRCPQAKTVCSDALSFAKSQPTDSFDVVSIIDGIEHMDKETGLKLVREMKRITRNKILLFTPEGYLRNEPHNAWGIEGADEHQTHKSGWTRLELKDLGFQLVESADGISQHDEPYTALMTIYTKE